VSYAAVVSVDNHREDPDVGRRGLREELAPAMKEFPGFESGLFLTAYERGRGLGVVVVETRDHAEQLVSLFPVGAEIRTGVTVIATEVFEVSAVADR
jgi:hypothetical protein